MIRFRRPQLLAAACAAMAAACVHAADPAHAPGTGHASGSGPASGSAHGHATRSPHSGGPPGSAAAGPAAPYAGQQARRIRSMTDVEVADIEAGRGMGLARPAELASFPGPQHVLELAPDLGLDADQLARTRALIAPMRAAAMRHGERRLDAERGIDRLFATRSATPQALARALEASAQAQAAVRAAHLEAHIAQTAILTPEQVARYDVLRGDTVRQGR
jgi:hypothetical protein